MSDQRIGIYGGSFDPPHIGHEALARLAVERFALDRLLVVPALMPVHRTLSGAVDAPTKLGWLRAVWRDEAAITVLDWECDAPTPTIATLRRFAAHHHGVVPLLLMGSDAAAGINGWVDYPEHRRLCNLALFHRGGTPLVVPEGWEPLTHARWLAAANARCGGVVMVDDPLPEVSASQVRQRLEAGKDVACLVPDVICCDVHRRYGWSSFRETAE